MTKLLPPCPCCDAPGPEWLGTLPHSEWFAGMRLADLLDGGQLYRCKQCRIKFRHPMQTPERYRSLYDNAETATWLGKTSRCDWDLIVDQIAAFNPRGRKVLDFGCYSGGLLSRLGPHHGRFGVEINHEAAQLARQIVGAKVWATLEEIPNDLKFDTIVVADVIEHMPDPLRLLESLASKLEEDGIVIISSGDADNPLWNHFGSSWWYCFYPEHITFICRTWVEDFLCARGWTLLSCRRFRYRRMGFFRRLLELLFTCAYGWFPKTYLGVAKALKARIGRGELTSVPGNGVTADHLLITLTRK